LTAPAIFAAAPQLPRLGGILAAFTKHRLMGRALCAGVVEAKSDAQIRPAYCPAPDDKSLCSVGDDTGIIV